MHIEPILPIRSRDELRGWLLKNSTSARSCWVVVSMTPAPDTLLYLDAVEEALCFGWIDGVKKKDEGARLVQRLSPRSPRSNWTELNKARVRRLEQLGLMTDEGRRALPNKGANSFAIDQEIEQRLQADSEVYANFLAFPELYRRVRIDTIQSCKKQPALYQSRLDKFIVNTRANQMYGQWHDHGRLLE